MARSGKHPGEIDKGKNEARGKGEGCQHMANRTLNCCSFRPHNGGNGAEGERLLLKVFAAAAEKESNADAPANSEDCARIT